MYARSVVQTASHSKLLVLVICIEGKPRNPKLIKQFSDLSDLLDFRLVQAIEPKNIDSCVLANLVVNSSYLIGREVIPLEIAVMLSHRKCYELITKERHPIALIIEDDVDILNLNMHLEPLKALIDNSYLNIATLTKSPWSCWTQKTNFLTSKFPPPCASCYLINLTTAHYALSHEPLGLADWPQWAHSVKFFHVPEYAVNIDESNSLIENLRFKVKFKQSKKIFFRRIPHKSGIKKIWQFRSIFWYRFLWKINNYRLDRFSIHLYRKS